MKILTPVKRIPDPEQKVKFKGAPPALAVDHTGVNWVPNQFDEYALEAGLRLIENAATGARAGEVIIASIGPKEMTEILRKLLGVGADRAILVDGADDNLDAEVVARTIVALVEKEKPDLVGQRVAAYLGWPQATFAAAIEVVEGGKALNVTREVDSGVEVKRVALPAVVTVDLRIVAPQAIKNGATPATHAYPDGVRLAKLKDIKAAKGKPLLETTLAGLGVTAAPLTRTYAIEAPPSRKAGIKVPDVATLVDKLRNEAKVL